MISIDSRRGYLTVKISSMKRDYLSVIDLTPEETKEVLRLGYELKREYRMGVRFRDILNNRTIALIFEKPSLRTLATFQIGIHQLGGYPLYMDHKSVRMGVREPVKDVARNLDRWTEGIVARVYEHSTLEELASYTRSPVINALSDLEHPCQALADFLTIFEITNWSKDFKLAFIGDGNNVAHSLMLISAQMGNRFVLIHPEGYAPNEDIVKKALSIAQKTGAKIEITTDMSAVSGADFVYTDVWASMGQEDEAELRKKVFSPYQVNMEVMDRASPHSRFMHCLPAHRGEEVTDEVIESDRSIVFEQAENRLHAQKGLIAYLYGK